MGYITMLCRFILDFVRYMINSVFRCLFYLADYRLYKPLIIYDFKQQEHVSSDNPDLKRVKNRQIEANKVLTSDVTKRSTDVDLSVMALNSKIRPELIVPKIACTSGVRRQKKAFLGSRLLRNTIGDVFEFASIFGQNAHEMLMEKYMNHGPIYKFSALGETMIFLFEVEDIEKLKGVEGRCPRHLDFKHLRRHRVDQGYPKGLLVSEGEEWLRQRKILSNPVMLKIKQYLSPIDELVTETISRIKSTYMINGHGSFLLSTITRDYAINAFGTVLYGSAFQTTFTEGGKIMQQFAEMARNNFEDAKKLMMTPEFLMKMHPAWKRHNDRWNVLLRITMDIIERQSKEKNADSILSYLLETQKLNDKEIFINLTDLLVASIDTTSTILQWCLYELACHPNTQERIREEAVTLTKGQTHFTKSELDKHQYLKAVIWETLRLHPVGFFTSRIIQQDLNLRGMKVPSQTNVAISMYVMGRNPDLFPHPHHFLPERWLSDNVRIRKLHQDVYFGFGARQCLGRKIAEMEVAVFLLKFCLEFEFTTPDKNIGQTVKLLLSPSSPIDIIAKRRDDQI